MRAKITVSDENGIVFGQVMIDNTYVGGIHHHTLELIGEEVVKLLPGGTKFLTDNSGTLDLKQV